MSQQASLVVLNIPDDNRLLMFSQVASGIARSFGSIACSNALRRGGTAPLPEIWQSKTAGCKRSCLQRTPPNLKSPCLRYSMHLRYSSSLQRCTEDVRLGSLATKTGRSPAYTRSSQADRWAQGEKGLEAHPGAGERLAQRLSGKACNITRLSRAETPLMLHSEE